MSSPDTQSVRREVRVKATPETIFPFLIEPELIASWMGRAASADPRPGGAYRIDINDEHVACGEYIEISPPRRVIFSWGWEAADSAVPPGSSTVEVTLLPDGDDTIVQLIHSGLPSAESREGHGGGWEHYLGRLASASSGTDPGPDPWAQPAGAHSQ